MSKIIKKLPHWVITDTNYAFNDLDSATAVEQTAKIYAAMNELIDDYNNFVDEINTSVEEFKTSSTTSYEEFRVGMEQKFNDFVKVVELKLKGQDQYIEETITYIRNNLNTYIRDNIVSVLKEEVEKGTLNSEILEGVDSLLDPIRSEVSEFKTNTTNEITEFKSTINETVNTFTTNTNNSQEEFKTSVNASITGFEERVTNHENSVSTTISGFQTSLNSLDNNVGNLENLTTLDKTSIVNAINETLSKIGTGEDTSTGSGNTNGITTLSSTKITMKDYPTGVYKSTVNTTITLPANSGTNSVSINKEVIWLWNYTSNTKYSLVYFTEFTNGEICAYDYFANNSSAGSMAFITNSVVKLTSDQTIAGVKTFSSLPVSSVVPTTENQLVNKSYVDSKILSGTSDPTSSLGNDGDLYLQYVE